MCEDHVAGTGNTRLFTAAEEEGSPEVARSRAVWSLPATGDREDADPHVEGSTGAQHDQMTADGKHSRRPALRLAPLRHRVKPPPLWVNATRAGARHDGMRHRDVCASSSRASPTESLPPAVLNGPMTKSVLPDGSCKPKVRAPQGSSWGGLDTGTLADHSA